MHSSGVLLGGRITVLFAELIPNNFFTTLREMIQNLILKHMCKIGDNTNHCTASQWCFEQDTLFNIKGPLISLLS